MLLDLKNINSSLKECVNINNNNNDDDDDDDDDDNNNNGNNNKFPGTRKYWVEQQIVLSHLGEGSL